MTGISEIVKTYIDENPNNPGQIVEEVERELLKQLMMKTRGNISAMARMLHLNRSTVTARLERLGI